MKNDETPHNMEEQNSQVISSSLCLIIYYTIKYVDMCVCIYTYINK